MSSIMRSSGRSLELTPETRTLDDDNSSIDATTKTPKQEGIPPCMFKSVIAASHPEFSSMLQQTQSKMVWFIF
ncbi:hypothetical protein S245_037154 [Arachis hypogaea]